MSQESKTRQDQESKLPERPTPPPSTFWEEGARFFKLTTKPRTGKVDSK